MTAPRANELRWLSASKLCETSSETVEFSIKGSLYAASVVLARHTANGITEIRGAGKASLKALFTTFKSWEYDVRSKRIACFEFQTEQQVGETKQNKWTLLDRALSNGFTKRIVVEPQQLLSVTELIFALETALPAQGPIAAFFPIGDRIQALKIERQDDVYEGRVTKILGDLSTENYLDLQWPSKPQFEIEFDEVQQRIEKIRLQIKPFGSFEANRR